MSKRASKDKTGTPRTEKISDRENQEKELTCDVKPGEISNSIKE